MNKIVVGFVVGSLIAVGVVVGTHERPFDESLYPGSDTAENFGACMGYMEHVHNTHLDEMDGEHRANNEFAKDIMSIYYDFVKEYYAVAMPEIIKGYERGKDFISDIHAHNDYRAEFAVAQQLCYLSVMDAHSWAMDEEPQVILDLLKKHNITYQKQNNNDLYNGQILDPKDAI